MDELTTMIAGSGPAQIALDQALLGLLLAFILGQVAAWTYMFTHTGLSYSSAFVQSIILLTVLISLSMMVIGSNIVIAFGLIGALSVIRFRNILKDTRDTAFVFYSLVVGMSTGTGSIHLALLGTVVFCLLLLYLYWTGFGQLNMGDGFVRIHLDSERCRRDTAQHVLTRYCRTIHLVSQRFQESGHGELSFRLIMRDPDRADDMVGELKGIEGISSVTFVLHEEQAQV
ncbi:MAG: DUF4956 domain-containing protein [Candidatus Hydrogenedentes bacterium]|nr:DUF4956 domain-containing protein [Candidatus Hydrogenedentota bacterium]